MIKFFRKIRQRLLSENKFSKYLIYAIGEIILVGIGILIALQINNWNEANKLQEEINVYFEQKLVNLKEDKKFLEKLAQFRLDASRKSKLILDKGLDVENIFEIINTTKFIFVEHRFTTTVERNESSITKYYLSKKEASINDLEQQYMNLIQLMTFEEARLNTFSEEIELDLWRGGYFSDNRALYSSMVEDLDISTFNGDIPKLILNKDNGKKSLEGLLRRTEIANPSIVVKVNELLEVNKQLTFEIKKYLVNFDNKKK